MKILPQFIDSTITAVERMDTHMVSMNRQVILTILKNYRMMQEKEDARIAKATDFIIQTATDIAFSDMAAIVDQFRNIDGLDDMHPEELIDMIVNNFKENIELRQNGEMPTSMIQ